MLAMSEWDKITVDPIYNTKVIYKSFMSASVVFDLCFELFNIIIFHVYSPYIYF